MKGDQVITPDKLLGMKQSQTKICAVVTYSYNMAQFADEAGIDLILVGDSVARVIYGYSSHTSISLETMINHTYAVSQACKRACVMADLPMQTMAMGIRGAMSGAMALLAKGHAALIKVEGGSEYKLQMVEALAQSGIPVVAHFGMPSKVVTKQDDYRLSPGGEGRQNLEKKMVKHALAFQQAGACIVLLSKVMSEIAKAITDALFVPTIGIGSGVNCDGQILVLEDLLGLTRREHPYYVKKYAEMERDIIGAIQCYVAEVQHETYPDEHFSHS